MPHPRMIGRPTYREVRDARQHEDPAKLVEYVIIPENSHNIVPGYYAHRDIVELLRAACRYPKTVRFIADMME